MSGVSQTRQCQPEMVLCRSFSSCLVGYHHLDPKTEKRVEPSFSMNSFKVNGKEGHNARIVSS